MATKRAQRLLVIASMIRLAAGVAAIALAPFLYRKHFLILALLRPTKGTLFVGGYLARAHKENLGAVVAVAIPLAILGAWLSYALGKAHRREIQSGRLPHISKRLLPPAEVRKLERALRRQRVKIIILGRLAIFPPHLLGSAAGVSKIDAKQYVLADLVGTLIEFAIAVGAGYGIGGSPKSGRLWLAVGGAVMLAIAGAVFGRQFAKE